MFTEKITVRFVRPAGYHEVMAVFIGRNAGRYYNHNAGVYLRLCYQHTGQHGECTDSFLKARRATAEEYVPLLRELQNIGYEVTVR